MYYKSRCIILKSRDLRDSDQLVTMFSEQAGKVTAVARGVKKNRSSLRACVQPFCHSWLFFSQGRELDLVTQGRIIDFYGNTREDLERMLNAVYLMELLDKSLMEKVPLPGLYAELIQVLDIINQEGISSLLVRYFESRLLVYLGYRPVIDQCVICGRRDFPEYTFSLGEGGMVCPDCRPEAERVMKLRGESVGLLKLLLEGSLQAVRRVKASPDALQQVEMFLEKYLEYYLERKFKLKSTISWLKRTVCLSD
jgi:DNA repair protein RecO (recombination protein O)